MVFCHTKKLNHIPLNPKQKKVNFCLSLFLCFQN